jgi:hypothetical protein
LGHVRPQRLLDESGVHCGRNAVPRDVDDREGRTSVTVVKDVDKIAAENKVVPSTSGALVGYL